MKSANKDEAEMNKKCLIRKIVSKIMPHMLKIGSYIIIYSAYVNLFLHD